jgi:hypothetical protein
MPLRLNDRNESVRTWRKIMNARFGGLYSRLHGPLPTDTDVFGPRAVEWQKEYQARTHQPVIDGVVSDNDLRQLGIIVPPVAEPSCVVFSINGAGSTWNMGYPYDIGETLDKSKCWHQPIGYNTNPFPMNTGVQDGMGEFIRQLDMPRGDRGLNCTQLPWGGVFYSMGALVGMGILDRVLHGDLGRFKNTFIGGATFGNPRRQKGHTFPGCTWSSGEGIATPTDHDIPDTVWEMAADKHMPGSGGDDLYTKMADDENDQTSRNMRAVWDIVNKGNPLNLAGAVLKLLAHPGFQGGYDAAIAAFKALDFFVVKQTGPHVRYQFTLPIENDPRDCWEIARGHMADLVAHVPARSLAA